MKQSNYLLPNFINVIYKKVEHNLRASNIDLARFNQYCLAVQLFHLKQYHKSIVGLPFSERDQEVLDRLCTVCNFHSEDYDGGGKGQILSGLRLELFGDFGVLAEIELLVNHFCWYEVLKDYYEQLPSLEGDYNSACIKLETSRKKFRLPARFKYNKTKRKDNPFFKGGVEVIIPEEVIPQPNESITKETTTDQSEASPE